jgi:signal transduction histidine kinase
MRRKTPRLRLELAGLVLLAALVVAPTVALSWLAILSLEKAQASFEKEIGDAYTGTIKSIIPRGVAAIDAEVKRTQEAAHAFALAASTENRLAFAESAPFVEGFAVVDSHWRILYPPPAAPEQPVVADAARDALLAEAETAEAIDGPSPAVPIYEKALANASLDSLTAQRASNGLARCLTSLARTDDAVAEYTRLAAAPPLAGELSLPLLARLRVWQLTPSDDTRLALLRACFDQSLVAPAGQLDYCLAVAGDSADKSARELVDKIRAAISAREADDSLAAVATELMTAVPAPVGEMSGDLVSPFERLEHTLEPFPTASFPAPPEPATTLRSRVVGGQRYLFATSAFTTASDVSATLIVLYDSGRMADEFVMPLLVPESDISAVYFSLFEYMPASRTHGADIDVRRPEIPMQVSFGAQYPVAAMRLPSPLDFWAVGAQSATADLGDLAKSRITLMSWSILLTALAAVVGVVAVLIWAIRRAGLARLQTDFVANVTHELKTPLTAIRSLAETIELNRLTAPERRDEFLAAIVRETERLTRLINNVLDFSRFQGARSRLRLEMTDLRELITESVASFKNTLPADESACVTVAVPREPLSAIVDRDHISRALSNLLDNAYKYSNPPRDIRVSLSEENGAALIAVADNGIGLAPSDVRRVWRKFYRVDTSLSAATQGAGLGLSLVKAYVEAHRGSVTVRSEPGKGSTFTISLPLAPEAAR